jgi:ATP-dependent exoDNAse (exonuclease V) beta subunit
MRPPSGPVLREQPDVRRILAERFERIMVDEFQDTNPRQLEILEMLERDNLFCVGDEFQSIYGFRHADVGIFRSRRAALASEGQTASLTRNFRARKGLLDAVNLVFAPLFGAEFAALEPGRADEPPDGEPLVELLITDTSGWDEGDSPLELGDSLPAAVRWRQAEARLLAQRIGDLIEQGDARPADVAVLVRAAGDLPVYERALEDRGIVTLASGGGGYWSRQQVVDLVNYLAALANPLDERALYAVLASPLVGLSSDGLAGVGLAARGMNGPFAAVCGITEESARAPITEESAHAPITEESAHAPITEESAHALEVGDDDRLRLARFGEWFAAQRRLASRRPLDALLERAVVDTGYDRHVLGLRGAPRRVANIHKLMRLAREFEATEGRDLRGFVAQVAAYERRQVRDPDAPVEDFELDAVRLMTIHSAKGLEFGVVCIADLGRAAGADHPALLAEGERVGLRMPTLTGDEPVAALDFERLRDRRQDAEAREEQRIFHVAMTRARERLLLSGAVNAQRWPTPRAGGPPIVWLGPALVSDLAERLDPAEPLRDVVAEAGPLRASVRLALNSRSTVGRVLREDGLAPSPLARTPALAEDEGVRGASAFDAGRGAAADLRAGKRLLRPPSLSYTALDAYRRCGYRFYVQRVLGLADVEPGAGRGQPRGQDGGGEARARGTLVHALLERLDFHQPRIASASSVTALAAEQGLALTEREGGEIAELVSGFVASPLCARLGSASDVRREHPFVLPLGADDAPLLTGVVDVLAHESDGGTLIVDYKTDRLAADDLEDVVRSSYSVQRSAYALAALRAGSASVEIAHCFLERPAEPAWMRFGADAIEGLEHELRTLADGIAGACFPVTDQPHRELCLTCPARGGLCSWEPALTLRPREGASPPTIQNASR